MRNLETIAPPVLGTSVWAFDADEFNAAVWFAVPDAWKGRVLEFHADGEAFAFGFGATITTVAATADSAITSNAISAQGDCAYVLANGQRVKVEMSLTNPVLTSRIAILGVTGTAGNKLRVTLCS